MTSADQHTRSGSPNSLILFVVYVREECITIAKQRALGYSRGFNIKPSGIKINKAK